MTESELRRVGPALAKYLDKYLFCCHSTQTFGHLGAYVRGSNPALDQAIALRPELLKFLVQGVEDRAEYKPTLEKLAALAGQLK